jgi:hypothetical protein
MSILRKLLLAVLTLSSSLSLLHASDAAAAYVFAVKIVNNTGGPIKVSKVSVKRKAGTTKECDVRSDQQLIQSGSSTVSTNCYVQKAKVAETDTSEVVV